MNGHLGVLCVFVKGHNDILHLCWGMDIWIYSVFWLMDIWCYFESYGEWKFGCNMFVWEWTY